MKTLIRIMFCALLLGATLAWALPYKIRGDRVQTSGAEDLRSLTFSIDSLGASAINLFIFKTPRGMLFTGAAVVSKTAFVGANAADTADATVKIKSGATIFSVNVDSGDVWQDYRPQQSSWMHFDSAVTCTLAVDDGIIAGTGGLGSQVVFWYNVDYTNR